MLKPYEQLSRLYDAGWGDFSIHYVSLINELLRERHITQARILDLACGTGILAVELSRFGHIVHGIDISPEMIDIAKSKAAGLPDVSFNVGDMVEFYFDGEFDLVTCTYDSVNYVRKIRDVRKLFSCISAVTNDKGLFLFDSNTKHMYLRHFDELQSDIHGEKFLQKCDYDTKRNLATTAFSFSDGTYEIHRQRPYSYDELHPLLNNARFRVLQLFSWFEHIPYSSDSPKFFCVAEKLISD